jgi:hypothetical protein
MINDIVCEYMVKRKLDISQIAKGVGVIVGGLGLTFLISSLGAYADMTGGMMGAMLIIIGVGVTVFFARRLFMIEYEYAYFNGEITFDKIYAKSKRKHLMDVELKSVEKMGRASDEMDNRLKVDSVKDFSASMDNKDTVYIYFKDNDSSANILLFFTPNQKMLDAMKTSVNAAVYREFFSTARTTAKKD